MTVSTHSYTVSSGTKTVNAIGGNLVLDVASSPHVTGSIESALGDMSVLGDIDPRTGGRLAVIISAMGLEERPQLRAFDLGVRSWRVNDADASVSIDLASDEAMVEDYAPLADDRAPLSLASSLRAVVNYVLDKANVGPLATYPSLDADVTPYWSVTNQVTNPRADTTAGFVLGGNAQALGVVSGGYVGSSRVRWQGVAAGWADIKAPADESVQAGQKYVLQARVRCIDPNRRMRVAAKFFNAGGALVQQVDGPTIIAPNNGFALASLVVTAPPGATRMEFLIRGEAGWATQEFYVDAPMQYAGDIVIPFFHGSQAADANYTYAWNGDADASTSTRTPIIERQPDALIWSAGEGGMTFLLPLIQSKGLRLVCDETRTWTLRDETYRAPGSSDLRYAVNITDSSEQIDRADDSWFDGRVTRYRWRDIDGIQQERIDAFALTAAPTKVTLLDLNTAYPGPGRSEYAVRRAQGRGRTVTATRVSDWRINAEQPLTITLRGRPIQTGVANRVEFSLDRDEVTITSRTIDTPAGAIDLLNGTIDNLPGTIDNL